MKQLLIILSLLNCLQVFAQRDSSFSNKQNIRVSIVTGYYNIKEIDNNLYKSSGQQLTYGLSYKRLFSKVIWGKFSAYYTSEEFDFKEFIPNGNYWEPPTMVKKATYLDIGLSLGADFINKNKLIAYFSVGFLGSKLLEGEDHIKGIYSTAYPYSRPRRQFDSPGSIMISVGADYFITDHIGIGVELDWREFTNKIVPDYSNQDPLLNTGISFLLNF